MKIKRSSWHYRINQVGEDFELKNDTLCRYFWRLVFKVSVFSFLIGFVGLLIYKWIIHPMAIPYLILLLFIFSAVVLPSMAIHYLRKFLGKPLEMPQENIAVEFLKAKKDKVCPLIEYCD